MARHPQLKNVYGRVDPDRPDYEQRMAESDEVEFNAAFDELLARQEAGGPDHFEHGFDTVKNVWVRVRRGTQRGRMQ